MSKRSDKVSSAIHREVAGLLLTRLRDPRVAGLTITRVEVSNDLHYAWIYVDFVSRSGGNPEQALAALSKAAGFLRNEIRQSLKMRHTPELIFKSDKGLEHSERIHTILEDLKSRGELPDGAEDVSELEELEEETAEESTDDASGPPRST